MDQSAHGTGRQHTATQSFGPGLCVLLYCEIECGFVAIGGRDRSRSISAVGFFPTLEQPIRRIA